MKRMWGSLYSAIAVLVSVLAACSSPRSSVRLGSLTPSQRSLDYDPGIVSWKLANQLTVALMPDKRVNLVSVEVRYRVGAADDPPGKTGLAHLVEHVMFARRAAPGGPEMADQLAAVALRYNAATSWDSTHYNAVALAPRLDDLLAIEAARMAGGCEGIDDTAVARERTVVLEELAERDPGDVQEPLHQAVFGPGHAYSHSLGGRDVAALTRDDVCRFIDAHYAPSQAILVVSGSIPGTAVHGITARFGAIARRATGTATAVGPVAWTGQVSDLPAGVDDPDVLVLFPAAPWGSTEWIYDNLVDLIILQRLRQAARREPWILDVRLAQLGGDRGGARGFVFRLTDAGRADEAADKMFAAVRDLPGPRDDDLILALASARQNELLDAFEAIDTRGRWCADFLQFTAHGRFQMRELGELQHIDPALLRARAGRLSRGVSQVVRVVPSRTHVRAGDAAFTAGASIDLPVWRAAVDPAEANRPIALPGGPRSGAPVERRLANGLRVVMRPDAKQPIFDARLIAPIPASQPAAGPTWIADVDAGAVQVGVHLGFAATSPRTARAARLVVAEMIRDRVEQVRSRLGASYGIEARYGVGVEGDLLEVDGLVDAGRAGEAVRQIAADLDGLRTGDAGFAADFVRARRAALVRALGDPVRSSIAADRLEAVVASQLPIDATETLSAEIASTTVDAARAVIAQDLQAARMVLMLSGQARVTAAAFAAAGVSRFETVTEPPAAR